VYGVMPPNSDRGDDRNASTLNVSLTHSAVVAGEIQAKRSVPVPGAAAEVQPWRAGALPRSSSPDMGRRADAPEGATVGVLSDIAVSCRSPPSRRRRPHGSPVSVPRPPAMPTLLEELDISDMADCAGTPAQVRPLLAHEVEFLCSLQRARRESSWFSRTLNSVLEACDRLVVSAMEERTGAWGGAVYSPDVNPCLPGQALCPGSVEQNPSNSPRRPPLAG